MSNDARTVPEVVSDVIQKGYREGVSSLNSVQRIVFLINDLDTYILMEGLLGYYDSSGGVHAAEVVCALEQIGADQSAALIRRANEQFPAAVPPSDWQERRDVLWDNEGQIINSIDQLGQHWVEYPDDLSQCVEAFVMTNRGAMSQVHGDDTDVTRGLRDGRGDALPVE